MKITIELTDDNVSFEQKNSKVMVHQVKAADFSKKDVYIKIHSDGQVEVRQNRF